MNNVVRDLESDIDVFRTRQEYETRTGIDVSRLRVLNIEHTPGWAGGSYVIRRANGITERAERGSGRPFTGYTINQ